MKNICFIVDQFPLFSETFIVNQVKYVLDQGFHLKILAGKISKCANQQDIIQKYNIIEKCVEDTNVPISLLARYKKAMKLFLKLKSRNKYKLLKTLNPIRYGRNAISLKYFYEVIRFVASNVEGSDIFHAHFGPNAVGLAIAVEIGLLKKEKTLVSFYGYDCHFKNEKELQSLKEKYKLLFGNISLILTGTEFMRDQLLKIGFCEDKIKLCPLGVDTGLFVPDKNSKKKNNIVKLLSVGRLVEFKGHEYGIKAVQKLVEDGITDIHYEIIGSGEISRLNYLQQFIEKNNLSKYIQLSGFHDQEYIIKQLQQCDVFSMTSTADENGRCETQGLVTAEAQACGVPAIGFKSGGVPSTIKDRVSGFLVEDKNISDYANKLGLLIRNKRLREKMSLNARKFANEYFNVEQCCNNIIKSYSI